MAALDQPTALGKALSRPVQRTLSRLRGRSVNVGSSERVVSAAAGGAIAIWGASGLLRRRFWGVPLTMIGAGLVWRGVTGHDAVYQALGIDRARRKPIEIEQGFAVNRPPDELYRFWRNLENLPRVFAHLVSVTELPGKRSRWIARGPADTTVQWDAKIVADREGEVIAWRTEEGSDVMHRGSVRFRELGSGRGTAVTVSMEYEPPAGKAGAAVAKMLGEDPERQIREDMRRFKALVEAGEAPTVEGQTSGRAPSARKAS